MKLNNTHHKYEVRAGNDPDNMFTEFEITGTINNAVTDGAIKEAYLDACVNWNWVQIYCDGAYLCARW